MKRPDVLDFCVKHSIDGSVVKEIAEYALALEADNRAMREACSKLHHWHCWGKDEEGMVVSAKSVRGSWNALANLRIKEVPPLAAERKTNESK